MLDDPFSEEIFPNIQSNAPPTHLEAISWSDVFPPGVMTGPSLISREGETSAWGFLAGLSWSVCAQRVPGSVLVLGSAEGTPGLGLPDSPAKSIFSRQRRHWGTQNFGSSETAAPSTPAQCSSQKQLH